MDDIKEMRSLTKDVEFINPPGRHGSRGSTKAHNEMLKIIDSASDYKSFVKGLNEWAKNRIKKWHYGFIRRFEGGKNECFFMVRML